MDMDCDEDEVRQTGKTVNTQTGEKGVPHLPLPSSSRWLSPRSADLEAAPCQSMTPPLLTSLLFSRSWYWRWIFWSLSLPVLLSLDTRFDLDYVTAHLSNAQLC